MGKNTRVSSLATTNIFGKVDPPYRPIAKGVNQKRERASLCTPACEKTNYKPDHGYNRIKRMHGLAR